MERVGGLYTIEGTDASGKANQLKLLKSRFTKENISFETSSFPTYDTPSGRIVGGPLLGKPEICKSYFENPASEDAIGMSMYYAANRRFDQPWMMEILNSGKHLILDRYVGSNLACQGGKIRDKEGRLKMFKKLEALEYEIAELPRPDLTVFLYMPFQVGRILKAEMNEELDEVEKDISYLRNQEEAYLELAELNNWPTVECFPSDKVSSVRNIEDVKKHIRSFDDIHEEVWRHIKNNLEDRL